MSEKIEPIVMRVILSEAQVDSQFACLFDRMVEKVGPPKVEGNVVTDMISAFERKNPVSLSGFNDLESYLSDIILKAMEFSNNNHLRIGEAVLARRDQKNKK